ncbi:MAG: uracil phosphoribosyltransferase [Firmicutes bacterium]|nr:uracil phosphoribosyltransferase [Bacillota bacterium]
MKNVYLIDHPLVKHKLALLRDVATKKCLFRDLLGELTTIVGVEAMKNLPTKKVSVKTPVVTCEQEVVDAKIAIIPILRAGLGMEEALVHLLPFADVYHVGIERDEGSLKPKEYYCKIPKSCADIIAIVADPMLATGGSAEAVIQMLTDRGCKTIIMLSIIASPEGINAIHKKHKGVKIYTAAIDTGAGGGKGLNEKGYIVPGLGDAGDRLFGTRCKG